MEEEDPPGVPEWVVTYGDMMSLLLTFFIMLVSLSEIVAEQKYRAVLTALDKKMGFTTAPVAPSGRNFAANSILSSPNESLGAESPDDSGRGGVKSKSVQGDDRRIKVTDEGTPQQVGSFLTFRPPTSNDEDEKEYHLTGEAEAELFSIARELQGKPNKIEIRSHVSAASGSQGDDAAAITDGIVRSYHQGHAVFTLLENWGIDIDRIRITAAGTALARESAADAKAPPDRIEVFITDVFSDVYVGNRKL
ncbi:MAG: flagellar motor protein MotB [Planctomycetales bacterium]